MSSVFLPKFTWGRHAKWKNCPSLQLPEQGGWKSNLSCKKQTPSQPSAWASLHPEGTARPQALIQFPTSLLSPASLLLRRRMSYRNSSSGALPGGSFDGVQGRFLRSHIQVSCFDSRDWRRKQGFASILTKKNKKTVMVIHLRSKSPLFCFVLHAESLLHILSFPTFSSCPDAPSGAVCYCDMLSPVSFLSLYWVLCICYWFIHHFDLWAAELCLKKVIIASSGRVCCHAQGCNLPQHSSSLDVFSPELFIKHYYTGSLLRSAITRTIYCKFSNSGNDGAVLDQNVVGERYWAHL